MREYTPWRVLDRKGDKASLLRDLFDVVFSKSAVVWGQGPKASSRRLGTSDHVILPWPGHRGTVLNFRAEACILCECIWGGIGRTLQELSSSGVSGATESQLSLVALLSPLPSSMHELDQATS